MGVSELYHVFKNEMLLSFKIIPQKASKVVLIDTLTQNIVIIFIVLVKSSQLLDMAYSALMVLALTFLTSLLGTPARVNAHYFTHAVSCFWVCTC